MPKVDDPHDEFPTFLTHWEFILPQNKTVKFVEGTVLDHRAEWSAPRF